jgi:hypothetical protein
MAYVLGIFVCAAVIAVALTGGWRLAFAVFAIRPARMTVERLRLSISDAGDIARVNSILRSFITAFNRAIARPRADAWINYCNSLPPFLQPFAHEGGAMGYTLRRLFRYDPRHFEHTVVRPRPEFRYLYYVGLGFWSGIRKHGPAQLERIAGRLDLLHGYLVFDGYGFARTFFKSRTNPAVFDELNSLPGYARNAAYQGVGRALYFLHMGDVTQLLASLAQLGPHSTDAAAGVGLAAVFVHPDRLDAARRLAEQMPAAWRPHYHLGMCFGLKARSINDLAELERNLAPLAQAIQDSVWAGIRECDRVELLVRAEPGECGYRTWRERVTAWMDQHIEYPLAGVRESRAGGPVYSGMAHHAGPNRAAGQAMPKESWERTT